MKLIVQSCLVDLCLAPFRCTYVYALFYLCTYVETLIRSSENMWEWDEVVGFFCCIVDPRLLYGRNYSLNAVLVPWNGRSILVNHLYCWWFIDMNLASRTKKRRKWWLFPPCLPVSVPIFMFWLSHGHMGFVHKKAGTFNRPNLFVVRAAFLLYMHLHGIYEFGETTSCKYHSGHQKAESIWSKRLNMNMNNMTNYHLDYHTVVRTEYVHYVFGLIFNYRYILYTIYIVLQLECRCFSK